jgi:uncharacterized protein (DUF736 family)
MKMAYEMKPSSGSLFKNDRKEKETHPDYKGKVMMPDGQVRWLSGWKKQTSAGDTWLSLAIGDPVQAAGGGGQPMTQHSAAKANAFVSDDSDIPF